MVFLPLFLGESVIWSVCLMLKENWPENPRKNGKNKSNFVEFFCGTLFVSLSPTRGMLWTQYFFLYFRTQNRIKGSQNVADVAFLILVLFHGGVFSKSRLPLVYRRPQDLLPPSVELAIRLSCLGFTLSPLSGAAAYYIIGSRSWKTL